MKRLQQLRIAFRESFAAPSGYVAAVLGAAFVVLVSVTLASLNLLRFTFREAEFPLALKLRTAAEVLWNGRVVFAHEGGWLALPLAALFGLNAAMIFRYVRAQARVNRAAGVSAVGIVIGLLGVGCAACGSVLLASLLGLGAVAALPFHGREFGWLGLAVTVVSTFMIAEKIADPNCRIPGKER
jgi:hypothetical protein